MAFDDYCATWVIRFKPSPDPIPPRKLEPVHEFGATFQIPGLFTDKELERIQNDATIIADILATNPEQALALLKAVAGDSQVGESARRRQSASLRRCSSRRAAGGEDSSSSPSSLPPRSLTTSRGGDPAVSVA